MKTLINFKNNLRKKDVDAFVMVSVLFITCMGLMLYSPDSFAFVREVNERLKTIQQQMITIGKLIAGLSATALIILLFFGKTSAKWAGCLVGGGCLLMASGNVIKWVVH